jgi:hypothetical protein
MARHKSLCGLLRGVRSSVPGVIEVVVGVATFRVGHCGPDEHMFTRGVWALQARCINPNLQLEIH